MDLMPDMPADDLQGAIRDAQAALQEGGNTLLRRDPLRLVLGALSAVLAVFGRSISRWERAVADVIEARVMPEGDREALRVELAAAVENGAYRGMRAEASRVVRTVDRRLGGQIGLAVGGAYVLGALSVVTFLAVTHQGPFNPDAAWAPLLRNNPDPRPALAQAVIAADQTGRRYARMSLWLEPTQPPPQ